MAGKLFHIEALVDDEALHDALLTLGELRVFNVQVSAVRPNNRVRASNRNQDLVANSQTAQIAGQLAAPPAPAPKRPHWTDQIKPGEPYVTVPEKLLRLMRSQSPQQPMSLQDLQARFPEHPKNSISQGLYTLLRDGKVVRPRKAVYALAPEPAEPELEPELEPAPAPEPVPAREPVEGYVTLANEMLTVLRANGRVMSVGEIHAQMPGRQRASLYATAHGLATEGRIVRTDPGHYQIADQEISSQ